MISHHQKPIFECRIKELNLGKVTLFLNTTRHQSEAVRNSLYLFSAKQSFKRYNSLNMDENGITLKQKFSGM